MTYDPERRQRLGLALKAARQRAGLSASAASALIVAQGLKCSRGTLLAWERGIGRTSREPFCSDLNLIASIYKCSVNDFFAGMLPLEDGNGTSPATRANPAPSADGQRLPPRENHVPPWHSALAGPLGRGSNGGS